MKAGLILAALSFAAVAQAKYELSCAQSELSVRWPSYESNSEYYVCSHLFGRQLTVACNPGEVFTFVLQSCTAPSRYIPAPALEFLPTAPPLPVKPNKDGYLTPIKIVNNPSTLNPPAETSEEEEASPVQKEDSAVTVGEPNKPLTPAPKPQVTKTLASKKPSSAAGKRPNAKKKKSINSNSVTTTDENEPSKKKPRKPGKVSGKKKVAKKSGKQKTTAKRTPKKSGKKSKGVERKQPKN